jgi:hypothetical protein
VFVVDPAGGVEERLEDFLTLAARACAWQKRSFVVDSSHLG